MRPTLRFAFFLWPAALVAAFGSSAFVGAAIAVDGLALLLVLLDARALAAAHVVVRRVLPDNGHQGEPFEVAYSLVNRGATHVRVAVSDGWTGLSSARTLAPGAQEEVRMTRTLARRGEVEPALPVAWLRTPFGLVERSVPVEGRSTIAVLPRLREATHFERLRRLRNLRAIGIVPTRQRGEGTELEGLRPYALGDAYRAIDWKATARRDRPVVREMRAERQQQVVMLLDCGRRMVREIDGRSRLDHAVEAALLLAQVALRGGDRVGLVAFADRVLAVVPPAQGAAQAGRIADAVSSLTPTLREPPYGRIVAEVLRRFPRRGLSVLFTDAAEPEAVRGLLGPLGHLARRHVVAAVLFEDELVAHARQLPIDSPLELYRAGAGADLAVQRAQAKRELSRGGALVVESAASKLSSAVVNRYLEVKARHLI